MLRNFRNLYGCSLSAIDGDIGRIRELYIDGETWRTRYFVVTNSNWLPGGRDVLIAPHVIQGIDEPNHSLAVDLMMDDIRRAPSIDTQKPISRVDEEQIHHYYGWERYWDLPGIGLTLGLPALSEPVDNFPPVNPFRKPERQTHLRSRSELSGAIIGTNGAVLGKTEDLIIDDSDWRVRYLVVRRGSWPDHKQFVLATEWVERISDETREIQVQLDAETLRTAPGYDDSRALTRTDEETLYLHYGRPPYWRNL